MTTPSIFPSDMTMISHFIIKFNQFTTNTTNIRFFKFFIFLSCHNQVFVIMVLHQRPAMTILFKNTLNKFVDCIFPLYNTTSLLNLSSTHTLIYKQNYKECGLDIFSYKKNNHYQNQHHNLLTNIQNHSINPFSNFIFCPPLINEQSFLCSKRTFSPLKHCKQLLQKYFLFLFLVLLNINLLKSLIYT